MIGDRQVGATPEGQCVQPEFENGIDLAWRGLDELTEDTLASITDDDLVESVELLHRLRSRLDAALARTTQACQDRGVPQQRNMRTAASLFGAISNVNPEDVRADARLGCWLQDFPTFASALAAGRVSADHLKVIRRCDKGKTHHAMQLDQEMIVEAAQKVTFVEFKVYMTYWMNAADPDGTLPKEAAAATTLRIHRDIDGTVRLKGVFDPIAGAVIYGAIADETQRLWRQEQEGAPVRTTGKRRADALTSLVRRGHDNPDAGVRPPLISIVMSETVAEQSLAKLEDPTVDVDVRWDDIDGRCELLDGTPLHPETAMAVFGLATLRRFVFDAKSRLIDVSYDARHFPEWIKHASRVVSRGRCSTTGCDAPYEWLHTDHLLPHNRGGPTRLSNANSRCGPDNLFKRDKIPITL